MENKLKQTQSMALSPVAIFMQHVYSWMCLGLLFTAFVAYMVYSIPSLFQIVINPTATIVLALALIGLAVYLPARIGKLSATQASGFFLLFAGVNGALLSPILYVYTTSSIFVTFVITSCMFASLAFYGIVTKRDLSPMGSFLFMGLIGIIIASLVNIFIESTAMQFVINVLGVIIFAGLTAYDNQKIRQMAETAPLDDALAIRRGSILGALTLYLDFINLFLFLLRFFGNSRN